MSRLVWTLFCLMCITWPFPGMAEVPQTLHYNGYLTNAAGEAVDCADAIQCEQQYDLTFRLSPRPANWTN